MQSQPPKHISSVRLLLPLASALFLPPVYSLLIAIPPSRLDIEFRSLRYLTDPLCQPLYRLLLGGTASQAEAEELDFTYEPTA